MTTGSETYPTWAVRLWLDNDQGSYYMVRDLVQKTSSESALADALKAYHEEFIDTLDVPTSFVSDLLQHGIDSVDWYQLATDYMEQWGDEDDA